MLAVAPTPVRSPLGQTLLLVGIFLSALLFLPRRRWLKRLETEAGLARETSPWRTALRSLYCKGPTRLYPLVGDLG